MRKIATLGFGEAARAFVSGWNSQAGADDLLSISTFDIRIEDRSQHEYFRELCAQLNVTCAFSRQRAMHGRDAVFSLVTADQALDAAKAVASFIDKGSFFFDCNSCSPATKKKAALLIEAAGGHYVDVAVMSPVYPARHRTPLLLSGPCAQSARLYLEELGMNAGYAGDRIGEASSIKMLRSVMVKGIEALTAECFLAARRAGVEAQVMASLQDSHPGMEWAACGAYNLERMIVHGKRRAAEMREVAATLDELEVPSRMALASAAWQDQIADTAVNPQGEDFIARADAILKWLAP